jgi:uroporphyrinogen-III synthase
LREAGVRVEIEANESSSAALADAIAKHYQRQASSARGA